VILDKPCGMTSTQAVGKVRWLYRARKAGHAGTLDPLATGVLPIALGEATKTVPIVQEGRKTYRFTLAWGSETTTDDREGTVKSTSKVRPARAAVVAILPRFTGTIEQVPPAFSAIKVDGERAYDLARAGEPVDLAPREITVESLTLLSHSDDATELETVTGKGTYVRALARDIARALGSRGHVAALRRTAVGPFRTPLALDRLEAETRDALLLPVSAGLAGLAEIRLDASQAAAVRSGNAVLLTGAGAPVALERAWASHAGAPVALGSVAQGQFRPSRVFR
jgi:tRNA pseudouridine55 synthase